MQAGDLPASQSAARPRARILVLEDDPSYAALVRHHLRGAAWAESEVEAVETLAEALRRLEAPGIDLVIADLNVPDSRGASTIAALAALCPQPIIAITAEEDPELRSHVMRAGAYEFLLKKALDKPTLERHVRLAAMQAQALRSLKESEARLRDMSNLSSDWFWETDAEHRFLHSPGRVTELTGMMATHYVGKRRWEVAGLSPLDGDWSAHRAVLERRETFRDLELMQARPDGDRIYLHIAGKPVFDAHGVFIGYRGTARDITVRKVHERLLALEHRVTRILAESRTVQGALLDVLAAVCESESWDRGRFFRIDEQHAVMRQEHVWSATPAMQRSGAEAAHSFARGVGLIGGVWQSGEPAWAHGELVFPVSFEARIIGALAFSGPLAREPDQRLQQTMRIIASQIGRFLRHKDDEAALRAKDAELRLIMDSVPATISHVDAHGRYLYANRAHALAYGHDGNVVGRNVRDVMGDNAWHKGRAEREQVLAGKPVTYELTHVDGSGSERVRSIHQVPEFDEHGTVIGYYSVGTDITEHKRAEARVRYLAHHDALTGLPNRLLFQDRVNQAVAQAQRTRSKVAVLFIDLDHFKHINDSLGHPTGDRVLQAVAERLRRCLRDGDSVCRLGGDEFVISLPGLPEGGSAALVAAKVLEALARPFDVDGREVHIGGSIGISVAPEDGADAATLMSAADTAMYHAKEKGRGNYRFFTAALNEAAQQRVTLAGQLRHAIVRSEFDLHYQPQVDLATGRLFSVEALLRWQRGDGSVAVSCGEFISVAEETGLIVPLGEWALREACTQLQRWRAAGAADLQMAVNLSARQFYQPNLAEVITQALSRAGLPPSALELEITESVLLLSSQENLLTLQRLADLGVRLSVDDFGTGYSSLAYLQRFPLHGLKIDRSFIAGIERDSSHTAIVTAIIAMARSLNLSVVAEGVEDAAQAAFLRERGCNAGQGYYYGRPMSAEALGRLLTDRRRSAPSA